MCPQADITRLTGSHTAPTRWRGFGQVEDLDIAFGRADRPALVSDVLIAAAPEGVGAAHVWALSLAVRLGALLTVWGKGAGRSELEMVLSCPAQDCGRDLEVCLPLAALLDMAEVAQTVPEIEIGDVVLRRPTGEDQRRWRNAETPMDEAGILSDLVVRGEVGQISDADEVLAEFDPLTCFSVETSCPHCAAANLIPVDLEAYVLARLAQEQELLFREVDRLARRYGWRDRDILAMPAQRRRRYLRIIEAEAGW